MASPSASSRKLRPRCVAPARIRLCTDFSQWGPMVVTSLFDVTARNIEINGSSLEMQLPSNSTASSPSVRLAAAGTQPVNIPVQGVLNNVSASSITLASRQIWVNDQDAVVSQGGIQAASPAIILSGGAISFFRFLHSSVRRHPRRDQGRRVNIRAGQLTISRSSIDTIASGTTSAAGGASASVRAMRSFLRPTLIRCRM
jgi:hypothetical protein